MYGGKEVEWIQLPTVEGYCKNCNENWSYTNGGKISIPSGSSRTTPHREINN